MSYTEAHVIGNTEYIFKTRLDWFKLDSIPEKQLIVALVDPDAEDVATEVEEAKSDLRRVELADNRAEYTLGLLNAYLLSFEIEGQMRSATTKRIRQIDPRHIPTLLKIAQDYHDEQRAEIAEFEPGNPTA